MTSSSPEDSLPFALQRLREAAEAIEDERASRVVASLEQYAAQPKLQLLVLGAGGSGRSTLVNTLLGSPDLLPRSPLPKAPLSVVLRLGADVTLEATTHHGIRTALPPSSLREILYDPAGAHREVEICAPAAILHTCEIRIEPLEAARSADEWRDLLSRTDFTILLLRAPALLSTAERSFVRDYLVEGFGLERVALLVNQMDLVEEEERGAVLDALSRFLGPFESRPVILDVSLARPGSDVAALERLMRDVVERHRELREAGLTTLLDTALEELDRGAERREALLSLDADQARRIRQTLSARGEWLEERIGRMRHRVSTFIGTLLKERANRDVEEFGVTFRRRLPAEIESVQDVAVVRRYLPGYIEQVWQTFLRDEAIAVRGHLDEEISRIDAMIAADLQSLLGEDLPALDGRGIDPVSSTPDSFVMPRRGKHFASSIAKGLSYQGLILTIWSLPLGLASLGAGQVIRRIYSSGIESSERKAYVEAAIAASREFEEEVLRRLDKDIAAIAEELQSSVTSVYTEAVGRIEELLSRQTVESGDAAAQREALSRVREQTIPEIRAMLHLVEAGEPV